MANKPELRFATAREFGDALANFTGLVTGPTVGWPGRGALGALEPVAAKPPAGPSHGAAVSISQEWQPPRRSMLPFVLAGVAALAVIGAIVFGLLPSGRAPAPVAAPSSAPTSNTETSRTAASSGATPSVAVAPPAADPYETPDAASASGTASKSPASRDPSQLGTSPADRDKGNAKSRVDQRGLVKDNPFK